MPISCNPAANGFQFTENYILGPGGEELTMYDGHGNWQRTNVYAADKLLGTYDIFHVREIAGSPSVTELIHQHGPHIAQVVRGDTAQLAESECNEVLQSRISYYANDLAVIGWNAAFLYDSTAGAEMAVQLLEYANSLQAVAFS